MREDRKIIAAVVLCICILPLAIALRSALTQQNGETKLFVDPPLIYRDALTVGERLSVNISVANVTDLKHYEFKLSFNTDMLDVVGVKLLPEANLPTGNWIVSDVLGIVWMNATHEGSTITTNAPMPVANIEFKAMNRGQSPLHLYDTALSDSLDGAIAHVTEDGMVTILKHDVAIASVTPSTHETYIGRLIDITVIAKNEGDAPENFTVKIYHGDTVFDTATITNLTPATNTTIMFTWNTTEVAAGHIYKLKAEATPVANESDLLNNVYVNGDVKVKIIGDVNGDNTVNINDWTEFDAAWGTHEGDPAWNAQADINGDGEVNNSDGVLIAENYRTTA